MRLIFIPGFGEDEFIFDHLHPLLPGENKLFLNLWKDLPDSRHTELNAAFFANELIQQYGITTKDVVIGHSLGGWIAFFIKQQVHCPIVQIASWTDRSKVVTPIPNRHLIFFFARTGLYFNSLVLRRTLKKFYQNKPSAVVFEKVFTRLIKGNKANVVNQLRLIYNPVKEPVTATPDLRIHARKDPIVRFPDGPVHEVPGDHFTLYTYPETVAKPINQFLQNHSGS